MISFIEQAQQHAIFHQKPMSRYIQMISIPLIFLSAFIVLSCIHLTVPGILNINFAILASVALLVYYFSLNWRLALVLIPFFILFCWIAALFSNPYPTVQTLISFIIMLSMGCVVHYAGFFMEGKSPNIKNLIQATIFSPLMIAAELFFLVGWMPDLKTKVYGSVDNIKQ